MLANYCGPWGEGEEAPWVRIVNLMYFRSGSRQRTFFTHISLLSSTWRNIVKAVAFLRASTTYQVDNSRLINFGEDHLFSKASLLCKLKVSMSTSLIKADLCSTSR